MKKVNDSEFLFEDRLIELTKGISSISFDGLVDRNFHLDKVSPLLDAILENNSDVRFDFYGCGNLGYIDELDLYGKNLIGLSAYSDSLLDFSALYGFPNLERLKVTIQGVPNLEDISKFQLAISNLDKLKTITIDLSLLRGRNDIVDLIKQCVKFPYDDKEVVFIPGRSLAKKSAVKSRVLAKPQRAE